MTHLLTEDEGASLLEKHSPALHDCIASAWKRWLNHPDAVTASKRTRACTVYDYITEAVEKAFADVPGVSLSWKHGSLHMTIDGVAVIKFKKFRGQRLRTSGIATNARNHFLQQADTLDGMVVTHLVVGYLLDELEQTPETIAVTCPLGKRNLWTLPLGPEADGGTGTVPTPIAPDTPDQGGTIIRSTKITASDDAANEE